jgi:hypothetical protein
VVVGGLLASTLVTLVVIPVTYTSATGTLAAVREGRWTWRTTRREAPAGGRPATTP